MPEAKRPIHVFLCHASEDKSAVNELYQRLKRMDWIDPWLDQEKLLIGHNFDLEIEKAVESADAVIVFISKNAIEKTGYVQKEIRLVYDTAMYKPEGMLFAIPLRLEECNPPHRFKLWHWGNYFGDEKERTYKSLLKSLETVYERISQIEAKEEDVIVIENDTYQEKAVYEKREVVDISEHKKIGKAIHAKSLELGSTLNKKSILNQLFDFIRERRGTFLSSLSILIVLLAFIFRYNIYRQITGRSVFATERIPISTGVTIPTTILTTQTIPPSPTFTLTIPVSSTPTIEIIKVGCVYTFHNDDNLFNIAERFGIGGNNYTQIENFDGMLAINTGARSGQLLVIPGVLQDKCLQEGGVPKDTIDAKGIPMMLVPAGDSTFTLDNYYYIDKYEVTNAFYKICVDSGVCIPPTNNRSMTRSEYYNNPGFSNYPVVYVNWNTAKTYCEWRGAHLPSGAEWERAARGIDGRIYPWGNEIDESYANYNNNVGDTKEVGSYEIGKSPFGVYDMAGNVWEWVSSSDELYSYDPNDGLRGGSWVNVLELQLQSDYKAFGVSQDETRNYFGFRCASENLWP